MIMLLRILTLPLLLTVGYLSIIISAMHLLYKSVKN